MEKDNKKSLKWTIFAIVSVLTLILIIIYANGSIKLGASVRSELAIIGLALGAWFASTKLFFKSTPELNLQDRLPKPCTVGERREAVEFLIMRDNYTNHVTTWLGEKTWQKGKGIKSLIHAFLIETDEKNSNVRYLVIINCHDPLNKRDVIPIEEKEEQEGIWKKAEILADFLADYPEEPIPTRKIINRNVLTGNEQFIEEQGSKPEEKEEKGEVPEK
jgi:hypothetical protein